MMGEWKEYRYTDLATIIGGGTPKTSVSDYWNGEIPWLSVKDFLPVTKYVYDTEKHISELGLLNSSTKLLEKNDIVISARGTIGAMAMIPYPMCFNQSCFGLRGNNVVDKNFLYYLTRTKVNELRKSAHGSVFDTITRETFDNLRCLVPPLQTQQKIGNILSSLDSKIELNKRINDNLEQQAQALFKSWFVDNPNSNWANTSLSEVASFVGGYSYKGEELTDFSNVAMATIKNFGRNRGFKAEGFKGINPSAKLKECHYVNLFDILVAHTDLTQNADVIGNAELLLTYGKYNNIIFSMDLVKVLPKEIFPYRFLLAAMLKNKLFKGHCLGYINGTTVLHLNKKALLDFEIRKPSNSEAKMMNETLTPYYKRMAELLQETDKLISLRDTLLPKLMSGELKITDINN